MIVISQKYIEYTEISQYWETFPIISSILGREVSFFVILTVNIPNVLNTSIIIMEVLDFYWYHNIVLHVKNITVQYYREMLVLRKHENGQTPCHRIIQNIILETFPFSDFS